DENQTADAFIVESLSRISNPHLCTVVTSDQHLAWHARSAGAKSQPVEEFRKMLNRIYHKKTTQVPKIVPKRAMPTPSQPKIETAQDRYERIFEEKLQESPIASSHRKKKVPRVKKQEKEQKEPQSDFERWLKIFENGA